MPIKKGIPPDDKQNLHPRNKNRQRYDLKAMTLTVPELSKIIQPNKRGTDSINFSDPAAVRLLNKAILHHYYGIANWEFPKENLCPPIPGRAEYIHHIADLLSEDNKGAIPRGEQITCLDIGAGASCIYPIIGVTAYDWNFIAADIDPIAIKSAQRIIRANPSLRGKIVCKLQPNTNLIFRRIIEPSDKIEVTICNPPFHASAEEALKGAQRKIKNLTGKNTRTPKLNHAGNNTELIYEGGEVQFITNMIVESKIFAKQCLWFTTLVSKEANLAKVDRALQKKNPLAIKTLDIKTGNKKSRVVAWTFFKEEERKEWWKN